MARAPKALPNIDFIDLGASSGGSLVWGARAFGGKGLGVDMSEDKAALARAAGHNMLVADARNIPLPDGCVRYCTLMDFLGHLPSVDDAERRVPTVLAAFLARVRHRVWTHKFA
jgi:ubiquinone/menaquinone biosynthesis C-methylase UbiE